MVRAPAVAGQFYPAHPDSLNAVIDLFFKETKKEAMDGQIIGLAVPHAGYPYSGAVAGRGYQQVAGGNYTTVVVIGPSHHVRFPGLAVYGTGGWRTPLGTIAVDSEVAAELVRQNTLIQNLPDAHRQEHSIEVQVPFLQKALPDCKIVPVMMADQSAANCTVLAQALARVLPGKKALIVASSDLYHGESYPNCVATDDYTLGFLERFDPEGLLAALGREKAMACGGGPVAAMMIAARLLGADSSRLLAKTNSNDVMGEKSGYVVGYGAAVFFRHARKP